MAREERNIKYGISMNTKRRLMRGRPWQVMLNGANTVKIQVPVYDEESYDTWVEDGYLKYEIQDPKTGNLSGETTLFR